MKKIFLMLSIAITFLACNAQNKTNNTKENETMRKSLVVFYSATGTTKATATQLATAVNADLWEIVPAEIYTDADLDWHNPESRSSLEMKDPEARPMIKACTDISAYDTIYIGFPIWWDACPRIINSWIDNNLLDNKTLIPFATSGGSSINGSMKYLRNTYPNLNWQNGKLLNDTNTLKNWAKELKK
ncbi:MAG: flavodoxin [Bacteroidales bacterium]|nr:flavodoxin [Bacteroidales bacterium]